MAPLRAAWLLLLAACAAAPARVESPGLLRVVDDVRPFVRRQLREMAIPGGYVAVLDVDPATRRERLWAEGFDGRLDGGPGAGATGAAPSVPPCDAVCRVASISKLFTATALMRLVEQGRVDLDVPVATYVPDFAPQNPFGGDITLRQLLGHRAGLVREPPVGHYFDPSEPSLAATVHSLNDTQLVFAPGSTFKYSNPGAAVVGRVIESVTGRPFEAAVRELVLVPLGLHDSDFAARADLVARQAHGVMWTYDGRDIPTPEFAFGFGPAANLRSTVLDLVHFAHSWFPFAEPRVLRPATQAAMWQLPDGQTDGCALGFFVRPFGEHLQVGHDGAVYGFASALRALPEAGLAVAVVLTKDFANATAEAIADRALAAALANRRGQSLPPLAFPEPVGAERARALAGHYRCGENWVELYERDGELIYDPNIGVRTRLRLAADGTLQSDDALSMGGRRLWRLLSGGLSDGQEEYVRDDSVPDPPPAELLPLLGEYGWDHDVLVVYEDRGRLGVLIEWVVRDLPERIGPDQYWFPPGMYGGDSLRFERDAGGEVVAAVVGGARFARRPDPAPAGFRVPPVRPISELCAAAARATPPAAPAGALPSELVDLAGLEPTLRFDLRYATADNFLGVPVYPPDARAKLQRPAAEALVRVHRALAAQGLGLCIFDAYRPWSVTKVFFDAVPPALHHFVADPAHGSRHNRGCAVDVTLYDLATGEQLEMPSGFDEFTPRAYPDYPGGTSRQRHYREVLRRAMAAESFAVYEHEWWHFDFAEWRHYAVGNDPLR